MRFSHLDRFSHDTTTRDDDANARTLNALDVIDALEEAFPNARVDRCHPPRLDTIIVVIIIIHNLVPLVQSTEDDRYDG